MFRYKFESVLFVWLLFFTHLNKNNFFPFLFYFFFLYFFGFFSFLSKKCMGFPVFLQ